MCNPCTMYMLYAAIYGADGSLKELQVYEYMFDCIFHSTYREMAYTADLKADRTPLFADYSSFITIQRVISQRKISIVRGAVYKRGTVEDKLRRTLFVKKTDIGGECNKGVAPSAMQLNVMYIAEATGQQLQPEYINLFMQISSIKNALTRSELVQALYTCYCVEANGILTPFAQCTHPFVKLVLQEMQQPTQMLNCYIQTLLCLPGAPDASMHSQRRTIFGQGSTDALPLYMDAANVQLMKQEKLLKLTATQNAEYLPWFTSQGSSTRVRDNTALTYKLTNPTQSQMFSNAEQLLLSDINVPLTIPNATMALQVKTGRLATLLNLPPMMTALYLSITSLATTLPDTFPKMIVTDRMGIKAPLIALNIDRVMPSAVKQTLLIPQTSELRTLQINCGQQPCIMLKAPVAENAKVNITIDQPEFSYVCLPSGKGNRVSKTEVNRTYTFTLDPTIQDKGIAAHIDTSEDGCAIVKIRAAQPTAQATLTVRLGKYAVYSAPVTVTDRINKVTKGDLTVQYKQGIDKAATLQQNTTTQIYGTFRCLHIMLDSNKNSVGICTPNVRAMKHVYVYADIDYLIIRGCRDDVQIHVKRGFIQDMLTRYNAKLDANNVYGQLNAMTMKSVDDADIYALHPTGSTQTIANLLHAHYLVEDL